MWVFHLLTVHNADINPTYRLASKDVGHVLPDSITEWGILAISASPLTGRRRRRRRGRPAGLARVISCLTGDKSVENDSFQRLKCKSKTFNVEF